MELFKLFGSIMVDSDEANKSISKTEKNAESLGSKLGNGIKTAGKWGAAIAAGAAVAVGAVAAVTAPIVRAAASAQAMNAQFEQVFGEMQKNAQSTIDGLGKDFGMLPNRIKPAFTQMTSMFKGLGMDTEKAMSTAEQSVTLVADAAAFYDKSFEDANSALNSFIKGNYEGGEAIGLFGSETQISAWAAKELGVEWKGLDEAGKQLARLEYAKAMQESAGATGQAARESNSLENQLGNLKQAWEDIKAKFGAPILQPAVNGLKFLADKISTFDTAPITNGISKVVDIGKAMYGYFKGNILPIFVQFHGWIQANMPTIRSTGETVFNAITGYAKTLWAFFKDNILPIYQDFYSWIVSKMPTIRATAEQVFNKITEVARKAWAFYKDNFMPILASLFGWVQAHMPQIKSIIESAFTVVKNVAKLAWSIFENLLLPVLKKLWDWVSPHIPKIQKIIGESFDAIVKTIDKVVDIFETVTGAIQKAVEWLGKWNNKDAKKKTVEVEERRTYSGGMASGIPRYATGTNFHPGGAAIVGERGPELISNLPRGAKVSTASETSQMMKRDAKQPIIIQMVTPDKRVLAEMIHDDLFDLNNFKTGRQSRLAGEF